MNFISGDRHAVTTRRDDSASHETLNQVQGDGILNQ
jgi:hypothetical protein